MITISVNTNRTLLTISSSLLDAFIASPASYVNVVVKGWTSLTSSVTKTYTSLVPITTSTDVASNAGIETILPSFFGATEFAQNVYKFTVTLTSPTAIQEEDGCLYVENGLKCEVDTYILKEGLTMEEKAFAGIQYQSLVMGTDCPCNCDKLFTIYDNLVEQVSSNPCKTC